MGQVRRSKRFENEKVECVIVCDDLSGGVSFVLIAYDWNSLCRLVFCSKVFSFIIRLLGEIVFIYTKLLFCHAKVTFRLVKLLFCHAKVTFRLVKLLFLTQNYFS
jgi:hypothetical protein